MARVIKFVIDTDTEVTFPAHRTTSLVWREGFLVLRVKIKTTREAISNFLLTMEIKHTVQDMEIWFEPASLKEVGLTFTILSTDEILSDD